LACVDHCIDSLRSASERCANLSDDLALDVAISLLQLDRVDLVERWNTEQLEMVPAEIKNSLRAVHVLCLEADALAATA